MESLNKQIEAQAYGLGQLHDIYDQDGRADVLILLEQTGGKVGVSARIENSSDFNQVHSNAIRTLIDSSENYYVFVPHNTSVIRDRFEIAKGIGHRAMHFIEVEDGTAQVFLRYGKSVIDNQANIFAMGLLAPEEIFRDCHDELGASRQLLMKRLDMSKTHVAIRAQMLELALTD